MKITDKPLTLEEIAQVLRDHAELYADNQDKHNAVMSIGFALGDRLLENHGATPEERKQFIHTAFLQA